MDTFIIFHMFWIKVCSNIRCLLVLQMVPSCFYCPVLSLVRSGRPNAIIFHHIALNYADNKFLCGGYCRCMDHWQILMCSAPQNHTFQFIKSIHILVLSLIFVYFGILYNSPTCESWYKLQLKFVMDQSNLGHYYAFITCFYPDFSSDFCSVYVRKLTKI